MGRLWEEYLVRAQGREREEERGGETGKQQFYSRHVTVPFRPHA